MSRAAGVMALTAMPFHTILPDPMLHLLSVIAVGLCISGLLALVAAWLMGMFDAEPDPWDSDDEAN